MWAEREEYGWKEEMEDAGNEVQLLYDGGTGCPACGIRERDDHHQLKQRIIRYCNSREMAWEKHFFLKP